MPIRRTAPACAVVRALLDDPDGSFWGYDLMKTTGYTAGTLYPVLRRLVEVGWLVADTQPAVSERAERRYYRWKNAAALDQARQWLTRAPMRSKAARDILNSDPL